MRIKIYVNVVNIILPFLIKKNIEMGRFVFVVH